MRPHGPDLWTLDTPPLPEGLRHYKFITDHTWTRDPANPRARPDGHGGENSTALVSHGPNLGGASAFRLASLNLHTYQEAKPLEKLAQAAEVFARLDVHAIALQEVGQGIVGKSSLPNAGEVLRAALEAHTGLAWYHLWRFAHVGFSIFEEGLSLLSRDPLQDPQEHDLGGRQYRRVALSATLAGPFPVRLCSVHTSWPEDGGDEECARLLSSLGPTPHGLRATLLAGDFNASPRAPQMKRIQGAGYRDLGTTHQANTHTFFGGHGPDAGRIDYHWLSHDGTGADSLALVPLFAGSPVAGVKQPIVSDHAGLLGIYC
jgi:maltose 6'-phosphate phosphatase